MARPIGVAADDQDLAEALFKQSWVDFLNGERLLAMQHVRYVGALSLAQFQQSCEKAVKSLVMWELGRQMHGRDLKLSHRVWSDHLKVDGRLKLFRDKMNNVSGFREAEIEELERYAPTRSWESPNSEYPWVEQATGSVEYPADFFSDVMRIKRFQGLAESVLKGIGRSVPRLGKIGLAVKNDFGRS